jgi:hypothetical protein
MPILSSETVLHKDNESNYSDEKKMLVVSLKGFAAKAN